MTEPDRCPECGAPRSAGICPRCLIRLGIDGPGPGSGRARPWPPGSSRDLPETGNTATSVLDSIAATIGSVPRVLLRDTGPGEEPGPIVRPHAPDAAAEAAIRYRVDGEIARGGMGSILKGRDPDLGRDVALKVLRDDYRNDAVMVRRFVEEAQIGGQLQHPGIVPIYELGTFADRRPFFSMKLVKGHTLAALLTERTKEERMKDEGGRMKEDRGRMKDEGGRMKEDRERMKDEGGTMNGGRTAAHDSGSSFILHPSSLFADRPSSLFSDLPRFLSIFEAVAQTMAYAHARGVIHRDLKPSNVMVGSFGEVQVMDWGLAKVLPRGGVADDEKAVQPERDETVIATARSGSDVPGLSRPGSAMGTPAYMAPEQARGEGDRVDERADVFALGSILCEVLTGDAAFLGRSSAEILRTAALGDTAGALARLDACGADSELITLAKDCLAREAEDRPRHAGALAARMTAYLAGVQDRLRAAEVAHAAESARALEAIGRARAERRARRFQVGLAASLLVLTTAGGLGFTYLLHQRQQQSARFAQILAEATALRDKARREAGGPAAWRDALAALERAEVQNVGGQAAALRDEIHAGLDDAERDARLRQELVDIRANQEDVGLEDTDAAYAAAFRAARLDLASLEPAEFARRLRLEPEAVVIELSAFLDDWSAVRRLAKRPVAAWRKPLEAAVLADPEPYRERLRRVLLVEDRKPQVDSLRALAAAPESAGLPAPTALLLGVTLMDLGQANAAVTLLRTAAGRYPGDVWVNYHLAKALVKLRPSAREEAVGYYRAARSLRPETAHTLAHLLESMGRGAEAMVVFRDLVARRPGNVRHQACLGIHLQDRGRSADATPILERAVATAREAVRRKSADAVAQFEFGNALRAQGKLAEAVAAYCQAIRLQPDYAGAHNGLGVALAQEGKPAEAIAAYREAIRFQPDDARAHTNLGLALADQGNLAEAVAEHGQAIRLQPDLAEAHYNLGIALRAQGKAAEAIAAYREAVRLKPDDAEAHANLGAILCDVSHDYKSAEAEFREAIRLRPDHASAHGNLGNALQKQGKQDEAIAAYRESIRLQPDDAAVHYSLGVVLSAQNKVPEAIAAYREAIRLKPDYAAAHSNLGVIYCDVSHDYRGAEAEFRAAIQLTPNDAVAHHNLGNALRAQGRVSEAFAEYREAIRLRPDYPAPHIEIGTTLANQGKWIEALAEYREAIRLQPDDAEAHGVFAFALERHGKRDEAIAEYRTAIRLEPKNAEAHCNLGHLLRGQGDYSGSLAMLRRGHELGSSKPGWQYPSAQWVADAERLAALAPRLSALLNGTDRPKDVAERLVLAQICYDRERHVAAVRFWGEALAADPKLGDDRQAGHRYNAACAAALAAAGRATGDPQPAAAAQARLRGQALDWLKAERAAWAKLLDSADAPARSVVLDTVRHWQEDSDLAGIRDPDSLAKLPEAERAAWRSFWAEVDALLARARSGRP
jgi:serine/threonine-protein kinase